MNECESVEVVTPTNKRATYIAAGLFHSGADLFVFYRNCAGASIQTSVRVALMIALLPARELHARRIGWQRGAQQLIHKRQHKTKVAVKTGVV